MVRLTVCLLVLLAAVSARADSEGYFCHTSNYLAYETRWGGGFSGVSGSHQLHVVMFGANRGFEGALSVDIAEFQTHGMHCENTGVTLLAWLSTHRVELGRDADVEYRGESPLPAGCRKDNRPALRSETCGLKEFNERNLGRLAEPGRHVLRPASGEGAVELVVEAAEVGTPGVVHHGIRSAVVKKDRQGKEVARREIFGGVFREAVD